MVFVAVDQCSLGLTDRQGKKDFGPVGTRPQAQVRGLQAMTALAVSESGRVLVSVASGGGGVPIKNRRGFLATSAPLRSANRAFGQTSSTTSKSA